MASARLILFTVFLAVYLFSFVFSLEQYLKISSLNIPVGNRDSKIAYDAASCTAFVIGTNQLHIVDLSVPERPNIADRKLFHSSLLDDVQFCDGLVFIAMTTKHFRPQSSVLQYQYNNTSKKLILKMTEKVTSGYKKLHLAADCTLMADVTGRELKEDVQDVLYTQTNSQHEDMICKKNGKRHVLRMNENVLSVFQTDSTELLSRQRRMTGTKGYNEACSTSAECKEKMECTGSPMRCRCELELTLNYYNPTTMTCLSRDTFMEECIASSCLPGKDLFCDTSESPPRCECNAGKAFNPSSGTGTCEDRKNYNDACIPTITGPAHCKDAFVCTSMMCKCPNEVTMYHNAGSCLARIGHDQTCDVALMNCISVLTCNAGPPPKCKCADETTHYFKPATMTCETRHTFGVACQASPDSCIPALACNAMSNTCKCAMTSQFFDGTSCAARKTFDEACITTPEDSCDTTKSLSCDSGTSKCICPATKYWNAGNTNCEDRIAHGMTCVTSPADNCKNGISCMNVGGMMKCQCAMEATMYYDNTLSMCVARKTFYQACQASPDACMSPLTCQSSKCNCPADQFWDSTTCAAEVTYDATCVPTPDDSCLKSKGLECPAGLKCRCSNDVGKEWDGTTCSDRKVHDELCNDSPDNCVKIPTGITCQDRSGTKKCECTGFGTNIYYDVTINMCQTRHVGGATCQKAPQDSCYLTRGLFCDPGTSKCICTDATKFYSTTGNDCISRHTFNQACQASPDSCLSTMTCQSGKCNCPADQYWTSTACAPEVTFDAACVSSPDDSCLKSKGLICSGAKCACTSSATKEWDGTTCSDRRVGGQSCQQSPDNCFLSRGLVCDTVSSTCKCSDDTKFYTTTSNSCIAKIALGSACNVNDVSPCAATGASCQGGTCSCNADLQQSGNTCVAIVQSSIVSSTAGVAMTGMFVFLFSIFGK